jgi:hypothetical protein
LLETHLAANEEKYGRTQGSCASAIWRIFALLSGQSLCTLPTNFLELRTREVRRMHQQVEKVGAELEIIGNQAPETPKSPKYGVFGTRSGTEVGIEGDFQQAGTFHAPR